MVGFEDRSVIILTAERTGCSWLAAVVSEVHRQLYGKPIYWDFEISRIISTNPKYDLPQTHASVYYVRPEWLLEREYDKIIILKRDLPSLKKAICRYYLPQLPHEHVLKAFPAFEKQLEEYYEVMYGTTILDERVLYVELSNLNYYPVAEFSRVLDFLEYPLEIEEEREGKIYVKQRPMIVPVKIEHNSEDGRDWDIQGTIINAGHDLGERYQTMIHFSGCQGMLPMENPDLWQHPECSPYGCIESTSQYTNFEKPNPWKMSPEEWKFQGGQVFRIKPGGMPDIIKERGGFL